MSVPRWLAAAAVAAGMILTTGCGETPPCEDLGQRLCAAMGATVCAELRDRFPADPAVCEHVLADDAKLTAQLEAAMAMAAARQLSEAKAARAPSPRP